jgi:signal peptidase I
MAEETALNHTDDEDLRSFGRELFEWCEAIFTALIAAILVMLFIFRPADVVGPSMEPTLYEHDRLFFTDLGYTPKQGDIVIVDSEGLGKFIVKRVIATGGQTLDIDFSTGNVTVDGVVLSEDYIYSTTTIDEGGQIYPVTVPDNSYFVMGDNRMHSTDSRDAKVGFVEREDIFGKVIFRIYPFEKIGTIN